MIEQVARQSAEHLREATTSDPQAGLADLHARQVRHQRHALARTVAAVVLALGVGWVGRDVLIGRDEAGAGPANPGPGGLHGSVGCTAPATVTCLGHHTYRFPLVRPVEWRIPPGSGVGSGGGGTRLLVESYRSDGRGGVTVMERVHASTPDGTGSAPGVSDSPRAFVHWVASRPFLTAGPVRTTTLAGRDAWQVRVTLAPGANRGAATCTGRYACYSITHQPDGTNTGIWGDMAAEYTAFRLPGGGTTVVWTWIFGGGPADLDRLDHVVHGISWPEG